MQSLTALSSVDGRYHGDTRELDQYLSEFALIKYRLLVMTEYVIALSECPEVPMRELTAAEKKYIRNLQQVMHDDADLIRTIEKRGYGQHKRTNHDVKACELYLRDKFTETTLMDVVEWIHFGSTSEDVNNVAYAHMLLGALHKVLMPALRVISEWLHDFADQYAALVMLGRTHGQPATPTTLGKEFNVFANRLNRKLVSLQDHVLSVKYNGATGNYNALHVACPELDCIRFTEAFIHNTLEPFDGPGFRVTHVTTQIESHDSYVELFDILRQVNVILIGFCQDMWRYISDDWLVQVPVWGEAGSSTMPHKVNPIDFENAEGNFGVANALLSFLGEKLPISRLQRDLSDSTVERIFGTVFGHCLKGYKSARVGLGKISANVPKIAEVLDEHPEVVTEAYQTILRSIGYPDPYSALRELSRGKKVTLEDLRAFVSSLDIPDETRASLMTISPSNYIGLAPLLARLRER